MTAVLLPFAALLLAADPAEKGEWNQWRGPDRDGQSAVPLPTSLDEGAVKEAWRVTLGPSYSGPIVGVGPDGGKRVFTTETVGRAFETAKCLDADTGEQIWEAKWEGAMSVPFFAKANGDWIRSTPALLSDGAGGGILFVAGIRDVLVALNAADGEELWRVDF
ncbi:MAG: PQQ-binding-like beta-propeller repeat protein, partial [Planctomycetota bacterium]